MRTSKLKELSAAWIVSTAERGAQTAWAPRAQASSLARALCTLRGSNLPVTQRGCPGLFLARDETTRRTCPEPFEGEAADELLVRCCALGPQIRCEAEEPVHEGRELGLEADDVEQMQEAPGEPGTDPAQVEASDFNDRFEAGDSRHGPLVAVGERRWSVSPFQARNDCGGRMACRLDCPLRNAGDAGDAHHVSEDEDLRVSGHGEIGFDENSSAAVEFDSGPLREDLAEFARLDAGGPDLALGFDSLARSVVELQLDGVVIEGGDEGSGDDLNAEAFEFTARHIAEVLSEDGEWALSPVDEEDAGLLRIDAAELLVESVGGEFADLAGHLHACRSCSDDDEGEELVDLARIGGDLGLFEGVEDACAQFEGIVDCLQTGCENGIVVLTEVGLACACSDDEGVVGGFVGVVVIAPDDDSVFGVDVFDERLEDLDVLLAFEDLAGRRCDVAFGEDSGGHLVEEGLEEVVARSCEQCDLGVGAFQRLRCGESGEAGSDDDDAVHESSSIIK